jgi:Zn ribbon nucleic-acid-binding protein
MRIPSAQTLLTLWEEGEALAPFEQGLWLLAAACPEQASDQLALWSIGRRNARLLALHQALFGPQLACLAVCPACAERLELTFRTDDLQALPWPD